MLCTELLCSWHCLVLRAFGLHATLCFVPFSAKIRGFKDSLLNRDLTLSSQLTDIAMVPIESKEGGGARQRVRQVLKGKSAAEAEAEWKAQWLEFETDDGSNTK